MSCRDRKPSSSMPTTKRALRGRRIRQSKWPNTRIGLLDDEALNQRKSAMQKAGAKAPASFLPARPLAADRAQESLRQKNIGGVADWARFFGTCPTDFGCW